MRRIGLSIYPDHSDEQRDRDYLNAGAKLGYSRIFMSMLEITGDQASVVKHYQAVISYAKGLGCQVILDVAPNIFSALGIGYDDLSFFAMLGADGIRLDAAFDGEQEALMTYNPQGLIIELNMSNDVAYLDNIISHVANRDRLYGCHNFYPQNGTGLPFDYFKRCCERFKQYNLTTAAFVSSQVATGGPWSINDGLPTLESHRQLPLAVQAKHLFATDLIDDVIIGNAYASQAELEVMAAVDRYQPTLRVNLMPKCTPVEREILLANQHVRRGDITTTMIRSTAVRKRYVGVANPPHDNTQEFQVGDVVVGNDQFGKYQNELQIVLRPHRDLRKNKVAHIDESELRLLPFLGPWAKFRFSER